jgi:hypothetical protein
MKSVFGSSSKKTTLPNPVPTNEVAPVVVSTAKQATTFNFNFNFAPSAEDIAATSVTTKKKKRNKKKKKKSTKNDGNVEEEDDDDDDNNNNDDAASETEAPAAAIEVIAPTIIEAPTMLTDGGSANATAPVAATASTKSQGNKPKSSATTPQSITSKPATSKQNPPKSAPVVSNKIAAATTTAPPTTTTTTKTITNTANLSSSSSKKKTNNGKNKNKVADKKASEIDDENDDFDAIIQQFRGTLIANAATKPTPTVSKPPPGLVKGSGPRFMSPNDPELDSKSRLFAKFGQGKNLVAIGPKKVRDPSWLADYDNHIAASAAEEVLNESSDVQYHHSPFSFSFGGL